MAPVMTHVKYVTLDEVDDVTHLLVVILIYSVVRHTPYEIEKRGHSS